MDKETARELALITSYIIRKNLLNGSVLNTFDTAYDVAQEFMEKFPLNTKWGVELQWEEEVEEFVEERYINGRRIKP